jgi:hypothetical protein
MTRIENQDDMQAQVARMQTELQELKQSNPDAYLEFLNTLNALLEELNREIEGSGTATQ